MTANRNFYILRTQVGNYIFWATFCIVGQPAAILLYYYDYVEKIKAQSILENPAHVEAAADFVNGTIVSVMNGTFIESVAQPLHEITTEL